RHLLLVAESASPDGPQRTRRGAVLRQSSAATPGGCGPPPALPAPPANQILALMRAQCGRDASSVGERATCHAVDRSASPSCWPARYPLGIRLWGPPRSACSSVRRT